HGATLASLRLIVYRHAESSGPRERFCDLRPVQKLRVAIAPPLPRNTRAGVQPIHVLKHSTRPAFTAVTAPGDRANVVTVFATGFAASAVGVRHSLREGV